MWCFWTLHSDAELKHNQLAQHLSTNLSEANFWHLATGKSQNYLYCKGKSEVPRFFISYSVMIRAYLCPSKIYILARYHTYQNEFFVAHCLSILKSAFDGSFQKSIRNSKSSLCTCGMRRLQSAGHPRWPPASGTLQKHTGQAQNHWCFFRRLVQWTS